LLACFNNVQEKHGDASFSFFFNAKENIQQNIHKQICNQFNLGIEPDALL
jgi:hypothetical protein